MFGPASSPLFSLSNSSKAMLVPVLSRIPRVLEHTRHLHSTGMFQRKSYQGSCLYNGNPSDACTVHFRLTQMSITRLVQYPVAEERCLVVLDSVDDGTAAVLEHNGKGRVPWVRII